MSAQKCQASVGRPRKHTQISRSADANLASAPAAMAPQLDARARRAATHDLLGLECVCACPGVSVWRAHTIPYRRLRRGALERLAPGFKVFLARPARRPMIISSTRAAIWASLNSLTGCLVVVAAASSWKRPISGARKGSMQRIVAAKIRSTNKLQKTAFSSPTFRDSPRWPPSVRRRSSSSCSTICSPDSTASHR